MKPLRFQLPEYCLWCDFQERSANAGGGGGRPYQILFDEIKRHIWLRASHVQLKASASNWNFWKRWNKCKRVQSLCHFPVLKQTHGLCKEHFLLCSPTVVQRLMGPKGVEKNSLVRCNKGSSQNHRIMELQSHLVQPPALGWKFTPPSLIHPQVTLVHTQKMGIWISSWNQHCCQIVV